MFRMPVSNYATKHVIAVQPDTLLAAVHLRLTLHRISSMPVLDARERAVGVVSRRDLLRVGEVRIEDDRLPVLVFPEHQVKAVMSHPVLTIAPSTSIGEAAGQMLDARVHRIYLEEDGRVVGVLSTTDIMRAIHQKRRKAPIENFMTSPVVMIDRETRLAEATEQLKGSGLSCLVVAEDRRPVGLFRQEEALAARNRAPDTKVEDVMSYSALCLERSTPVWRAAAQAYSLRAHRIVAMDGDRLVGILTGINLAGAAALG